MSVLINIIQHKHYFFSFQAHITAVCSFLSKSFHIMLEFHLSSSGVNNKCITVKGQHWIWLIYALHNFVLCNNLHVLKSNHHCYWKFHKFHRKTPVVESLFSLKMLKLYKEIFTAWTSRTSADIFFQRNWIHKRLKNTIDLLLFYREHWICRKAISASGHVELDWTIWCNTIWCNIFEPWTSETPMSWSNFSESE